MCLSLDALVLFLNLIGHDIVATEPGRIVVQAETRSAHWVAVEDDEWCTMAPQIDRALRFAALR